MFKRSRKSILFAAALCWFAPVSAKQESARPRQQPQDVSNCPEAYARPAKGNVEVAKAGRVPAVIIIPRPDTLGVTPALDSRRAALLP